MAPLLLLVWLGSALGARQLVPWQCRLGPEFWCRDPGTAAQCERQQDCARLPQQMSQAGSIKCSLCTSLLKKLKSMVGDDPDEDSIAAAEDKLCGAVGRGLRRLCRYTMKKFKAKITQALLEGEEPREICVSLRMCRAAAPAQGFPPCPPLASGAGPGPWGAGLTPSGQDGGETCGGRDEWGSNWGPSRELGGRAGGLVTPSDACDLCLTFTSLAQPDPHAVGPGWDPGDILNGTCKRHFGGSLRCNDFVATHRARLLQALRVPRDPLATCRDAEACPLPEDPAPGEPSSGTDPGAWP